MGSFLTPLSCTDRTISIDSTGAFGGLMRGMWAKVVLRESVFHLSSICTLKKSICLITHLLFSFPSSLCKVAPFPFYIKEMQMAHPPWTYHTALLSAVKASGVRVGKGQIQSIGFNKVFFNQGAISTTPKSSYKHFKYIFLFVFSNSSPKFVTYFYCLVQLFTTNTFNSNYYYFILLMVITIPHSRRKFIILRCL